MKKKLIIFAAVLTMALGLAGCNYAKTETVNEVNEVKEEEQPSSMFVEVERGLYWKVYYQKDTKVMYVMSCGSYNCGNFTVLVNPDGTPMIYEEDYE